MRRLEVFYDYICPYCLKGHEYLKELLPHHPDIKVVWQPCEAHPRPEQYGIHSDLCIQGYFYALENCCDLWEYHKRMYRAALKDRVNIEDPEVVAGCVHGLFDHNAFLASLLNNDYADTVVASNDYAYEQSGVWAVPSYRMDGKKLDSVEGVGVSKEQLAAFLKG